jgi:poly(3-hydroxybutyrate) depolymerase
MSLFVRRFYAWALLAATAQAGFVAGLPACEAGPEHPLPALHGKIGETSVSGISSGAYMAGQFEIAHSRLVTGAAIIAGGPYGCAESLFADMMPGPGAAFLNLSKAINGCMLNALELWGVPNPALLADKAKRLADEGRIDPIDGVRDDRVYLFSGTEDHTVVPAIVAAAADFYARLGLEPSQLKQVTGIAAGHAFVTEDQGLACSQSSKPFIVDCDYDQAGDLLAHIYGKLNPRAAAPSGTFIEFDQRPFTEGLENHGLSDHGFVYVPATCASSDGCRVHIAFHGCSQNETAAGGAFVRDTGFARWADTNRLVVLFPQTMTAPMNPQGCWDWWGYTSHDYLTRQAPQIVAVHRMLERLAAPRSGS